MKGENLSASMAKLIMIVSLIVGVGAIFGVLGYFWKMPKNGVVIDSGIKNEEVKKDEIIKEETINGETADWKTYESDRMKFSMKYPSDWNMAAETVESAGTKIEFRKGQDARVSIMSGIRYDQDLNRNYTLEEWVNGSRDSLIRYNPDFKEKKIIFSGKDATEFFYKAVIDNPPSLYRQIYAENDNLIIYEITINFDSTKENIYNPLIDQILSTFKFTEKDETADWKTYRNEKYGFEFKYPPELVLEEKKDEQVSWESISVFMRSSDFNGYILINNAGIGTGFGIDVSSEDIKIDNVNTKLEILDSSVDNERATKVSFNENNNEYFWLYRFDKEDLDKIKLSKEIYSTFKFTEKDETADWKTYENKEHGFEFKYDNKLLVSEEGDSAILSHSIPFEHSNPCDFGQSGASPVLKDLIDFKASIKIIDKNLIDSVISTHTGDYIMESISDDKLIIDHGIVDEVVVGSLKGYVIYGTFEGCGNDNYYFPLNNTKTLFIQRLSVPELLLAPEAYSNLPNIISTQDADMLFDRIIYSFKLILTNN